MPNRRSVINALTQDVVGNHRWDGLLGEHTSMPGEEHEAVEDAMAAVLERAARVIDWGRLLEEALWRHQTVHPDLPNDNERQRPDEVCGECLKEALLSANRYTPDWKNHPTSPCEYIHTDWPVVVADTIKHRKTAVSVPIVKEQTP